MGSGLSEAATATSARPRGSWENLVVVVATACCGAACPAEALLAGRALRLPTYLQFRERMRNDGDTSRAQSGPPGNTMYKSRPMWTRDEVQCGVTVKKKVVVSWDVLVSATASDTGAQLHRAQKAEPRGSRALPGGSSSPGAQQHTSCACTACNDSRSATRRSSRTASCQKNKTPTSMFGFETQFTEWGCVCYIHDQRRRGSACSSPAP
eukprot:TRINITY_DN3807_c0_g1_i5.p1 TRINITY_DN3807_c0_g1~~TRINITY_DN3807_c0_g1_i5.p1  ORF type:complete len:209 (-),score=27.52 TRINITY_DN3807_c0_g1_i5:91-717(-)